MNANFEPAPFDEDQRMRNAADMSRRSRIRAVQLLRMVRTLIQCDYTNPRNAQIIRHLLDNPIEVQLLRDHDRLDAVLAFDQQIATAYNLLALPVHPQRPIHAIAPQAHRVPPLYGQPLGQNQPLMWNGRPVQDDVFDDPIFNDEIFYQPIVNQEEGNNEDEHEDGDDDELHDNEDMDEIQDDPEDDVEEPWNIVELAPMMNGFQFNNQNGVFNGQAGYFNQWQDEQNNGFMQ